MQLNQNEAKKLAGRRAIDEFVRDGMRLGLGSGTTSHFFVRELAKHIAGGLDVTCTATSRSCSGRPRQPAGRWSPAAAGRWRSSR